MDKKALTDGMMQLTEILITMTQEECSDEFLEALKNLIDKACLLSKNIQSRRSENVTNREQRPLSRTSDVVLVLNEIPTIQVDSDSERSLNTLIISTSSGDANTEFPIKVQPIVKLKRMPQIDIEKYVSKKQCVVSLHRMDVATLVENGGLVPNFVTPKSDTVLAKAEDVRTTSNLIQQINDDLTIKQKDEKKTSPQVSENEKKPKPIRKPTTTYIDYLSRPRDVCCVQ